MNKVAIVTGSNGGIGRAAILTLQEKGFYCIGVDIVDGDDRSWDHYDCDVGDLDAITEVFSRIETEHGTADVLVNNAGISLGKAFLETDRQCYDDNFAINSRATFFITQVVARQMIAAGKKRAIVNIISVAAYVAANDVAYAMAKAGVASFTRCIGKELADKNIRVNAIAPGPVWTPMTAGAPPAVLAHIKSQVPMNRLAEPSELANVIAFLASDESSFMTGTVVHVNGGMW